MRDDLFGGGGGGSVKLMQCNPNIPVAYGPRTSGCNREVAALQRWVRIMR